VDWNVIAQYLPLYKKAAWLTLRLGLAGIVIAIVVGLVCALVQYYKVPVLRRIVGAYIELSRNTPLLVQLFFIYYGLPKIGIKTNAEICGIAGLAFLGGSYMAEAFRSGLESIEPIQTESAMSLGMDHAQTMRYIWAVGWKGGCAMPDLGLNVLLKGKNAARLLGGLWVAMRISLISVVISIPLGILLGVLMSGKNPIVKAILRVYLEIIRIMPQMVLLFLVFFGTTRAWGWDLSGETASIIVFVLWGTAEMSDLVRGALISIPKHQYESSEALGLTKGQTYLYIIIPQTVRRLIPLSINLITRMIKTTSLVLMIGVVEVLKVAQQIIEANRMSSPNAAFGIYLVVFLLYFLACWPISLLASYLEKKWR
jgi:polar amino acid transport system permease protein